MAQLPLAIRRDVRDRFEDVNSAVQKQISTVKSTLGLPVTLDIQWSLLWSCLEANSTDKADFVPYVLTYAAHLLVLLNTKLEDDSSEWADQFLELLTQSQSLKISLQSHDSREARTKWISDTGLVLYIPSSPAKASLPSSQLLIEQLDNLFAKQSASKDGTPQTARQQSSSSFDGIATPMSSLTFNSSLFQSKSSAIANAQALPILDNLPRPEQLFSRSRHNIISMHLGCNLHTTRASNVAEKLVIQSSHEQSLRLIHDYFTKWARPNMQTQGQTPLMQHKLFTSAIGHSTCDTLVIEPIGPFSSRGGSVLNPALYQCFIEDVLGYETVYRGTFGVDGGFHWEFRRSQPIA